MSTLSISWSFSPNTLIASSQVNQNFTDILNWANGNVGANNIPNSAIITAMIATAAVTSSKGGLGIDTSGLSQGGIPYLSATGVWSVLPASTLGYVLQTGGAGGNPSFVPAAATAHAITRGFELVYSTALAVIINAGTLYHNTTQIEKANSTSLTLSVIGNWYDGALHSYSGGAGWCYVGVDSSRNIRLLYNNAPNKSDTEGNANGTLLYYYNTASNTYYRVIGAFHVFTDNTIDQAWTQYGNKVIYKTWRVLATNNSTYNSWTSITTSDFVPGISNYCFGSLSPSGNNILYITNNSGLGGSFPWTPLPNTFTNTPGGGATYWALDILTTNTLYFASDNSTSSNVYIQGFYLNIR